MKKDVSYPLVYSLVTLYPLVYSLVTLSLILPIATTIIESAFSAMNIIKNRLRNQMRDQWMNDCLERYI